MPDDSVTLATVKLLISELRIEIFKVMEGIAGATVGTKAFHDAVGKLPPGTRRPHPSFHNWDARCSYA